MARWVAATRAVLVWAACFIGKGILAQAQENMLRLLVLSRHPLADSPRLAGSNDLPQPSWQLSSNADPPHGEPSGGGDAGRVLFLDLPGRDPSSAQPGQALYC
jgi:hypothetical protein